MGRIYRFDEELDYAELGSGLAQGSRPATGTMVARSGFDVLVLCAVEYQPPAAAFAKLRHVYRLPIDDKPELSLAHQRAAFETAAKVAEHLRRGARVLVTCWAGLNRSGLVSAMALRMLLDAPADDVIAHIRAKRSARALGNEYFAELVRRMRRRPRVRPALPSGLARPPRAR